MNSEVAHSREALESIQPRSHARVIDLVEQAGHDVSDWGNFMGEPAKAAVNPRYCYEWAFTQQDRPVILSIWFEQMQVEGAKAFQNLNVRQEELAAPRHVRRARSNRFDDALQLAWREKRSLRVIVCEGDMRDITVEQESGSSVKKRLLDPSPWALIANGAQRLPAIRPTPQRQAAGSALPYTTHTKPTPSAHIRLRAAA